MPKRPASTTIAVNGFALREIRVRSGINVADLAEQLDIGRPYLTKIELGHSQRVSPKVYSGLCHALDIKDRRALAAHPHDDAAITQVSA